MRVTNGPSTVLTPELSTLLAHYRLRRNFDAQAYRDAKVGLIHEYFTRNGLDAAVVGLSGGIDSALVYGLLKEAQAAPASPLRRVVPLLIPALQSRGATAQEAGVDRARQVCAMYGDDALVLDHFTSLTDAMVDKLETALGLPADDWARGQVVSYARTPLFYGATSLLTLAGLRPLLAGTTNLTEGGYLGFFGKASDAMTDLQLIADIYKSEVYAVARTLDLPSSVLTAVPTGDMYDGRTDEEVFGASYDFVELYYHWLQDGQDPSLARLPGFEQNAHHLERLHSHNAHKYQSGLPSVFLNVYPCSIPGGWQQEAWQ